MARTSDPHSRDALLKSARVEFARRGYDGTSVEAIAQGAGLAKGSFYLHFRSKEDCFLELVHQLFAHIETLMTEFSTDVGQLWQRLLAENAGEERWRSALRESEIERARSILRALWAWRDVVGLLVNGGTGTRLGYLIDRLKSQIVEQQVRWIHLEQRCGLLRSDIDPDVFIRFVAGGYIGLAQEIARAGRQPDFERWANALVALLDHGIGGQGALDTRSLASGLRAAVEVAAPPAERPPAQAGWSGK
ncbi:MAG: TetR/AcrR family transcriptional regulator [Deltaproteobacteria bacterium]|nr:TetR/AcrR family transcriptional regulator [Deltaproteobacteria bacterium]